MEGTGANLRLPLNPPFFFESQADYDRTSGAEHDLDRLHRPAGARPSVGQLRAWDPNLRPQFTQQWNAFAEYLLGSRSSINVGLRRQQVDQPRHADRGQPAAAWRRAVRDVGAAAAAPAALPVQPADHQHQHHGVARAQRLPRAADDVPAAHVERARLRGQLHPEPRQLEQPRLLRVRRRGLRRRVPGQQLRHRGQLRSGVLRRAAHLLDGGQLPGAGRPRPRVRLGR